MLFSLDSSDDEEEHIKHSHTAAFPIQANHRHNLISPAELPRSRINMQDVRSLLRGQPLPPADLAWAARPCTARSSQPVRSATWDIPIEDLQGMQQVSTPANPTGWEQDINPEDLKEKKVIGHGVWGDVYVAKWNGCKVAVKYIRPNPNKSHEAERNDSEGYGSRPGKGAPHSQELPGEYRLQLYSTV
jgi:hypothetical protein